MVDEGVSSERGDAVQPRRVAAQRLAGLEVTETHISSVFFDGAWAHKVPKPVQFPFLDQSTPELRLAACRREIEVNRRFSPDVYVDVEEVVDADGRTVDHAVLMHRLPAERRLAALARRGDDAVSCVRAIARVMAARHADAARSESISAVARPDAVRRLWEVNLGETARLIAGLPERDLVTDVEALADRYVAGRAALFAERIDRGLVVDGHGDLLAEDIFCLPDGPRILDALAFDDRLRWGDVLLDVGFLAMDLERLGRLDLSATFMEAYREHSAESHPRSLEHHYVAYRASVRAKIAWLRGGSQAEASLLLTMCHRHLLGARVRLVLVGGLPGTGKTTTATELGRRLGWAVLQSDSIRKELAGLPASSRVDVPFREGMYAPSATGSTYATMLERARTSLERGESVILDASFGRADFRRAAADVAASTSSDLVAVQCVLPREVADERLIVRARRGGDASDATPLIAARMAEDFDEWPEATQVETLAAPALVLPSVVRLVEERPR